MESRPYGRKNERARDMCLAESMVAAFATDMGSDFEPDRHGGKVESTERLRRWAVGLEVSEDRPRESSKSWGLDRRTL
ncbi:hypothetical protein ACFX12_019443 [Malus domestica]